MIRTLEEAEEFYKLCKSEYIPLSTCHLVENENGKELYFTPKCDYEAKICLNLQTEKTRIFRGSNDDFESHFELVKIETKIQNLYNSHEKHKDDSEIHEIEKDYEEIGH